MTFKHRKKPLVIEAYHWLFNKSGAPTPTWLDLALHKWPYMGGAIFEPDHDDGPRLTIATLKGDMIAIPGDYIIRGVEGEIYPCKQSVFDASYDKVEAEEKDE
ncbi:MAG TPA: hypothetical protein ENI23_09355 [bacterium]|nr:hypothetical protein [bacterium]